MGTRNYKTSNDGRSKRWCRQQGLDPFWMRLVPRAPLVPEGIDWPGPRLADLRQAHECFTRVWRDITGVPLSLVLETQMYETFIDDLATPTATHLLQHGTYCLTAATPEAHLLYLGGAGSTDIRHRLAWHFSPDHSKDALYQRVADAVAELSLIERHEMNAEHADQCMRLALFRDNRWRRASYGNENTVTGRAIAAVSSGAFQLSCCRLAPEMASLALVIEGYVLQYCASQAGSLPPLNAVLPEMSAKRIRPLLARAQVPRERLDPMCAALFG